MEIEAINYSGYIYVYVMGLATGAFCCWLMMNKP